MIRLVYQSLERFLVSISNAQSRTRAFHTKFEYSIIFGLSIVHNVSKIVVVTLKLSLLMYLNLIRYRKLLLIDVGQPLVKQAILQLIHQFPCSFHNMLELRFQVGSI